MVVVEEGLLRLVGQVEDGLLRLVGQDGLLRLVGQDGWLTRLRMASSGIRFGLVGCPGWLVGYC